MPPKSARHEVWFTGADVWDIAMALMWDNHSLTLDEALAAVPRAVRDGLPDLSEMRNTQRLCQVALLPKLSRRVGTAEHIAATPPDVLHRLAWWRRQQAQNAFGQGAVWCLHPYTEDDVRGPYPNGWWPVIGGDQLWMLVLTHLQHAPDTPEALRAPVTPPADDALSPDAVRVALRQAADAVIGAKGRLGAVRTLSHPRAIVRLERQELAVDAPAMPAYHSDTMWRWLH